MEEEGGRGGGGGRRSEENSLLSAGTGRLLPSDGRGKPPELPCLGSAPHRGGGHCTGGSGREVPSGVGPGQSGRRSRGSPLPGAIGGGGVQGPGAVAERSCLRSPPRRARLSEDRRG